MKALNNVAAIDFGTNTAHILIASYTENGELVVRFKKRHYIFLNEGDKKTIDLPAQKRINKACDNFVSNISLYNCKKVKATATEAFRISSNGYIVKSRIEKVLNIPVEIIDWKKEAHYIYLGVSQAVDLKNGNYLIMDIGGGSVEFIGTQNGQIIFQNSYSIGLTVLQKYILDKSKYEHPYEIMDKIIADNIFDLIDFAQKLENLTLIGAAGSFEVLLKATHQKDAKSQPMTINHFMTSLNNLIIKSAQTISELANIPIERAHYVQTSVRLITNVVEQCKIKSIIVSPYALKEGVIKSIFLEHSN